MFSLLLPEMNLLNDVRCCVVSFLLIEYRIRTVLLRASLKSTVLPRTSYGVPSYHVPKEFLNHALVHFIPYSRTLNIIFMSENNGLGK